METPFIRARQPHTGRTAQDWHDALISQPKYHRLAISKMTCHTHADITKLLCPWSSSPFTEEVHSDSLETLSHISCASVMCQLGNRRKSLTACCSSIVRDGASPTPQLPSIWYVKLTTSFNFACPAPSFVSPGGRDQGLLNPHILTPTRSFSKLPFYHVLLVSWLFLTIKWLKQSHKILSWFPSADSPMLGVFSDSSLNELEQDCMIPQFPRP